MRRAILILPIAALLLAGCGGTPTNVPQVTATPSLQAEATPTDSPAVLLASQEEQSSQPDSDTIKMFQGSLDSTRQKCPSMSESILANKTYDVQQSLLKLGWTQTLLSIISTVLFVLPDDVVSSYAACQAAFDEVYRLGQSPNNPLYNYGHLKPSSP